MVFTVEDLGFQSGMELTVTGRIKSSCEVFSVNIGHSLDIIAFHFNPRFNHLNDVKTIVCNSKKGDWSEEKRFKFFPFQKGQDFKVSFTFNHENFYAKLTDGIMITFPNCFGEETFNHLHVLGDVVVTDVLTESVNYDENQKHQIDLISISQYNSESSGLKFYCSSVY